MNPPVLLNCVAGRSADFARQTPNADNTYGGVYAGNEIITVTIWPEGSEVAALVQVGSPNTWLNAALTIWLVSLNDAQTATLPVGVLQMEVTAPIAGGRTGVLFRGEIEVFATAGTSVPSNLASAYYVGKALTQIGLAPGEWEYLPDNIAAASDLIRKYCNRLFSMATYVETLAVELDGYVRFAQIPISTVQRVQADPDEALTVGNMSATLAWIGLATTGDGGGFTGGPVVTGMTLYWLPGGPPAGQTVAYTAGMTIAQLATAIDAVGNGWSAIASEPYGSLPVTEIMDGEGSKGAGPNDPPYGGAVFHVYSENLASRPHPDDGQKTGIYWVGRINDQDEAMRWGPGGYGFGGGNQQVGLGKVRATYVGGFSTIPLPVQMVTAELVKANFERLKTEAYLKTETGQSYSYTLAEELVGNLPKAVRQTLSQWRISNA
jgi:hypothetical protein